MQLVAYGAQDIYLTGNPQITFFKVVYRRHTNFSMEAIEQTLNGSTGYGNKVSATVSRNGDLVGRMYVEYTQATADTANCANPGTALLDEITCEIGGQQIDKHYGHSMEVMAQLEEENPTASNPTNATVAVNSSEATSWTRFQKMSGSGGVLGDTTTSMGKIFVPLRFWFCKNAGLALPLIALQYHEVKLSIKFQTQTLCKGAAFGTVALWADYIYLDTDERRRFAQVSHEYLIEQLQFQSQSTSTSHDLNFNHPVKELIWTGVPAAAGAAAGPSTPSTVSTGSTYKVTLNGHDRFVARDYRYFTRAQVWQHHTGAGSVNVVDSIAVYSFALKPEEHQPSGTCNFSRIDNAQLKLTTTQALNIYAVNYNVLRIMSGMGGLAYSN